MDFLEWIVKIGLALLGIQYALGPILVWWSQKMPEAYRFNKLDSSKFLSERSDTFLNLHKEILSRGFEYVGSSEMKASNSSMYFSIYYNIETKLCCTLSSAHSKPSNTTQMEFTQLFADGSLININNNPLFHVYPEWDKKKCYRFPNINSFTELLDVSRKLINSYGSAEKTGFTPGEEFSVIESHLTDELLRLVSLGWVSKKVFNGERRLTVKGAILLTWQLCWPIKKVMSNKDEKLSNRALQNA
jgi:hypothetical protein